MSYDAFDAALEARSSARRHGSYTETVCFAVERDGEVELTLDVDFFAADRSTGTPATAEITNVRHNDVRWTGTLTARERDDVLSTF